MLVWIMRFYRTRETSLTVQSCERRDAKFLPISDRNFIHNRCQHWFHKVKSLSLSLAGILNFIPKIGFN